MTTIENPYEYIKELQANFNYSKLKFCKEYYENLPPEAEPLTWNVYFGEGFNMGKSRFKPGEEIRINKHFEWNGEEWLVPAIHSCSKGLVVDVCRKKANEVEWRVSFREKLKEDMEILLV